jgi:hypothetical protein
MKIAGINIGRTTQSDASSASSAGPKGNAKSLGRTAFAKFTNLPSASLKRVLDGFDTTKTFVSGEPAFNGKRASMNRVKAHAYGRTPAQRPSEKPKHTRAKTTNFITDMMDKPSHLNKRLSIERIAAARGRADLQASLNRF